MISRRSFFAGLAALPLARLLEPLARWLKPAAPVVANTRRAVYMGAEAARLAFEKPVGRHCEYMVYDDIETPNFTTRVSVQGGPVLWEA